MNNSIFDCNINENNSCFVIFESNDKTKKKGSSLQTLTKIARIVEEKIPYQQDKQDAYSNLSSEQLYQFLGKKAKEIYADFKDKELKQKSLSNQEKVGLVLRRIQNSLDPPKVFPVLPTEVIHHHITNRLPVKDLGNFAQVNRHANLHAKASLLEFAKQYGYEGNDVTEAKQYVKSLKLVSNELHPHDSLENSLSLFEKINYKDLFKILEIEKIYNNKGNKPKPPDCHPFLLKCAIKNPPPDISKLNQKRHYKNAIKNVINSDWKEMADVLLSNTKNKREINKCLILSVEKGSPDVAQLLLEQKKGNPNKIFKGNTLIHIAYAKEDLEMLGLLISLGADVNTTNSKGNTLLIMAIKNFSLKKVSFLLDYQPKIDARDLSDNTPLMIAAGNLETTLNHEWDEERLFREGKYGSETRNKVIPIINIRTLEIFKLLLKNGADINAKNLWGNTALMEVSCSDTYPLEIIEFLLKNGANVNEQNLEGRTPLMYAIRNFDYDFSVKVTNIFLNHGAKVNAQDLEGNTPLHMDIGRLRNPFIITKILLDNGADVNKQNLKGQSPLSYLVDPNHFGGEFPRIDRICDNFLVLLAYGADINIRDQEGNTMLIHAVYRKELDYIKLFLANQADPNVTNRFKNSALHVACYVQADIKIIKLLLEHNADVNLSNAKGETPLSIAKWNFSPMLYMLLKSYDKS